MEVVPIVAICGATAAPARRSLRRGPAPSGVGVGDRCSFCGAVCVGARRSVSGPGALCVGARHSFYQTRRSLCRGPAAPCVAARCSLSRLGVGAWRSSPKTLFSRYRRSVCRVWRFLSVCRGSTICACVGARRSVCRGPASLCQGPARGPALFVSGPGALCVGGPALFLSGSGALCQGAFGARLFLYRSSALFGALQRSLCQGPAAVSLRRGVGDWVAVSVRLRGLYVGARRSVSGPGGPLPRLIWHVLAVCVSGPGAFCRGLRRSLCRAPALRVGARSFYRAPALSVRVYLEPALFLYGSSALFSALCVAARRSPPVSLCRTGRSASACVSGPGAPRVVSESVSAASTVFMSARPALFVWGQRSQTPIRVPPIRHRG